MSFDNFLVTLCSVPVERAGQQLDRLRSQAPFGIMPKVAIVSLVKALESNGYDRTNWDFYDIDMLYPEDSEIRDYFEEYRPSVIGLSAVVSTSYSQVKRIASIARSVLPECAIVLGGNMAASKDVLLAKTDVDVVVHGDGEDPFIALCNYFKRFGRTFDENVLSLIPGISFFNSFGAIITVASDYKDLSAKVVLPDYDILGVGIRWRPDQLNNYFKEGIKCGWFDLDERAADPNRRPYLASLFSTKGCVAKCTFCQRTTFGYGLVDLDDLANHCRLLAEKYRVGFVNIADENFGANRTHSYRVAQVLNRFGMLWVATGVRCKSITESDIRYYKVNGCVALKYGVESGSQEILDVMEKRFKVEDVYSAIYLTIKNGLFSPLAVMVGMPGETMNTVRSTGRMIGEIASLVGVHPKKMGYDIFYALPLLGTPLYEYGEIIGVLNEDIDAAESYLTTVSNAGIYKRYFVNLNGAHVSEFLFWDVLVALEASRVFDKNKAVNPSYSRKYAEMVAAAVQNNPRHSLKYKALSFTWITWIVDKYVVGSSFFDKIPRVILYPLIRWFLYMEYLLQGMDERNRDNNIFKIKYRVPRLDLNAYAERNKLKRLSLRDVIASMKASI